jgi:tripartite-type tricarboxylate transporter receptor subunit TctC
MTITFKQLTLFIISFFLCLSLQAVDFPNRPVKIIVPFAPGGTLDVTARLIAAKLHDTWGQAVVVENKLGGNGAIGADFVVRSPPDGYTLMYNGTLIVVTQQLQKVNFDILKDLVGVVQPAIYYHVLGVNAKLGVNNLNELIELAKKQPGHLNYGSGGMGSSLHLYMERMKSLTKVDIAHIPYKGSAPAMQALMSGEVDMVFDTSFSMIPLIKSGRVKPIVVSGDKRLDSLPNVPTLESYFPSLSEEPGWHGIFAPNATPKAVVQKIANDVKAIVTSQDMINRFKEMEFQSTGVGPDAFSEIIKKDFDTWGKLIRENNIHSD